MKSLPLPIIVITGITILIVGAVIIFNLYWDPVTLQSRNVREYFDKSIISEIYASYGLMVGGILMGFFGYRKIVQSKRN
jgi:hypothetical protein